MLFILLFKEHFTWWKKQNKSAYNLLLYLFVRGRSNAIIRSTFSTEDRNGNEGGVCEGDDDGYYDKNLASGETSKARGKDMRREGVERRVEMMEGGSRALHLGANDFWVVGESLGVTNKSAGVGLFIKNHSSACHCLSYDGYAALWLSTYLLGNWSVPQSVLSLGNA